MAPKEERVRKENDIQEKPENNSVKSQSLVLKLSADELKQEFTCKWNEYATQSLTVIERDRFDSIGDRLVAAKRSRQSIAQRLRRSALLPLSAEAQGSPAVLCLCASALRCLTLVREFREAKQRVVKLFAKHVKVTEQRRILSGGVVDVGVGTPSRVAALIADESLRLTNLKAVVLDCRHADQKRRTLLSIAEVRAHLFQLFAAHLPTLFDDPSFHIILF